MSVETYVMAEEGEGVSEVLGGLCEPCSLQTRQY